MIRSVQGPAISALRAAMSSSASHPIQTALGAAFQAAFHPAHTELRNDSAGHNVPAGSETHFSVLLVSDAFAGQSRVARHRLVYAAAADQLAAGVHALAIRAYTPEEYAAKHGSLPTVPRCAGGDGSLPPKHSGER